MSKKKNNQTLDELVEEALVPKEEQPYEVPENWVWVKSSNVLTFVGGGTPSKSKSIYWDGNIPWATVKDIKEKELTKTIDYISEDGLKNSSASIAEPNELLLITRLSPGKSVISKIRTAINQDLKIVRPKLIIDSYFLWLFYVSNRPFIESISTGTTVKGIQVVKLNELPFPLPPLAEQKRIVYLVKSLFAKIDEAKQLIEEEKETFELRRAAIINQMYMNSEHVDGMNLGDICEIFSGKGFKRSEYTDEGIRLLKIQNVSYRKTLWKEVSFLPQSYLETEQQLVLKENDIIMALNRPITNNKLKISLLNRKDLPAILYQRVACIRPKVEINLKYLYYYLTTSTFLNEVQIRLGGTDQPYINIPPLKSIKVPIVSLKRQHEVVLQVEALLSKLENINIVLRKFPDLDDLKSAILAKAFKGELGTSDSNDEPAVKLLKSVLQEKLS